MADTFRHVKASAVGANDGTSETDAWTDFASVGTLEPTIGGGDRIIVLCYDASITLVSTISFNGGTYNAGQFIVRPASGNRHDLVDPYDTGNFAIFTSTQAIAIRRPVWFEGIQFRRNTNSSASSVSILSASATGARFDGCVFTSERTSASDSAIAHNQATNIDVINCVFEAYDTGISLTGASGVNQIHNNFFKDINTIAVTALAGRGRLKNNVFQGCTADVNAVAFDSGSSHTTTDLASIPWTQAIDNETTSATVTFDASSYKIATGDTNARELGVDMSADGGLAFDWDGTQNSDAAGARTTPWDRGPYEESIGGGGGSVGTLLLKGMQEL